MPNLIDIIKELDKRVREKYDDESLYIIDEDNRVHMAHIDIHYTFSVNGVASLHTEILEKNELNNFYEIYPEKFNNKTNGITFRRWLMHCNHELTALIEDLIGDGFKKDAIELEKLQEYVNDEGVLQKLLDIKSTSSKAAFIEVFFNTYNPLLNFTPLFLILKIPEISLHKLLQNSLRCLSSLLYCQTSTPLTVLSLAELT